MDFDIEALDPSGDGVARNGRDVVFVPFTIPGERVRVDRAPRGGPPRRGGTGPVEVLDASPHRVVPRCPHFGPCGGCSWQHIAYSEQLRLKTGMVQRLVSLAVPGAPAVRPTLAGTSPDDPWGYRQKVHFVFGRAGAGGDAGGPGSALAMGHYARGSRRIVPVRECPVHDPAGNRIAFAFFEDCVRAGVAPAETGRGPQTRGTASSRDGVLKSIAVRVAAATGEIMATLVVSRATDTRLRSVTRRLLGTDAAPTSLHLNVHPRDDGFIFGRETRRVEGPDRLRDEIGGTSYLISPTAFFQTNVRAAALLVRLVAEAVPPGANVLDLYAGAGLFALALARAGHTVVAVEEDRAAVADGEASRRLNGVAEPRCRFVAQPVERALARVDAADAVVLDPPREGCTPRVTAQVFGRLRPQRAVYVSCNPEALARDLERIVALGYAIDSMQPVDMFPHTAHVETVAVLSRGPRSR
jgi:23S rRNA (uracil1939-C5)-methyltransferase